VKEKSGKDLDDLLKVATFSLLDAFNPETGNSIFDTLELDKDKHQRLHKAVLVAQENMDTEIEEIYSRIFHVATDSKDSIFNQAMDKSKPVLEIFLSMMVMLQENHDYSRFIIRSFKDFKKLMRSPSFPAYIQGLKKEHMVYDTKKCSITEDDDYEFF
jgi:hypothetical protein